MPSSQVIDEICRRFESAWRSGTSPEIADYLETPDGEDSFALLNKLIAIDIQFRVAESGSPDVQRYAAFGADAFKSAETEVAKQLAVQTFQPAGTSQGPQPLGTESSGQDAPGDRAVEDPFATEAQDYEPQKRGRYIFRRPLAEGGLGVVSICYDTDLNREVALKEIRNERADDSRARLNFCAEAELTGSLEHPGVVPIYSLGNGADGRPYYAMQLISGTELRDRIVRFHSEVQNGTEEFSGPGLRHLLQRLIDVCNVIHYAHSRGVLHRDLKSVNVMLGRYGETLVIDWGLAKTTGTSEVGSSAGDESGETDMERPVAVSGSNLRHTQQGSAMGTIAYAPPEQLNGQTDEIDARSDIYSIGAMLYEVLTGNPPCNGMGITQALRAIESHEIPPPIEVSRETSRPLNAIACKAMSAAREDRYQTAKELRNDLQRWLDDEPVSAYDESSWERLWRWKRQHETFVRWATASLVVVTMISLFAAYGIDVARKREKLASIEATQLYQVARQATDSLLTKASDRLEEIPDITDVREALLVDAAASYKQMAEFRTDDPELRRESTKAGIRLADVYRMLEKKQDAIVSLQSAREMLPSRDTAEDQILLARTYIEESRLYGNETQDDIGAADAAIREALPITQQLTESNSASNDAWLVRGQAKIQLGIVSGDLELPKRAVESFKSAATTLSDLLERDPDDELERHARLELIRAYTNEAFFREADDPIVRQLYQSAIEQAQLLTESSPNDPRLAKEYGGLLNNYGDYLLRDLKDRENAKTQYQESLDYLSKLAKEKGSIPEYRNFWALALIGLGDVATDRNDHDRAVQFYTDAAQVADRLLALNSNRISFLSTAAQAKASLATALLHNDFDRSESLFSEAMQLVPGRDENGVRSFINYGWACLNVARCKNLLDESSESPDVESHLNDAIKRLGDAIEQVPDHWDDALEEEDLAILRERRSKEFTSLKPES